jgi:hypothetical protein
LVFSFRVGAAQIAAHQTRDGKLGTISHAEMQRMHKEIADRFGNQPEQVIRAAEAHKVETIDSRKQDPESALTYARDKNFERRAVADERELMRDALKTLNSLHAVFNEYDLLRSAHNWVRRSRNRAAGQRVARWLLWLGSETGASALQNYDVT